MNSPAPFQPRCTLRDEGVPGFDPEHYKEHAEYAAQAVFDEIRDVFGLQGIRTLNQVDPEFFRRITASMQEAFQAGMLHQQVRDGLDRLDEGMQRNAHMLTQVIQGAMNGRNERETAIAVMAANAGMSTETINLLLDGPHLEGNP